MRPDILNPLFAEITTLPGVGPRLAKLFERLAGPRVSDLCWHLPSSLIDRRYRPSLAEAVPGRIATVKVRVMAYQAPHSPKGPWKVLCTDGTRDIELVYFHAKQDWLRKLLPDGAWCVVSGKLESYNDRLQMNHPDHVVPADEDHTLPAVEAVYPLTGGLGQRVVQKAIQAAVARAPVLPEWHDASILKARKWPDWRSALEAAHHPETEADLLPEAPARQRLAYDELLANQLALSLIRLKQKRAAGRSQKGDGHLVEAALQALLFPLTGSQRTAFAEIAADMAEPHRMLRLLQGDVGSGKTVVALLAMLTAVEAGQQAALMAPTEILARQHFNTIAPLATAAGIGIELLTGRDKGAARKRALERLAHGRALLAIGTHALFQDDVLFRDLGLAVIDEQHRFGVHQRLQLAAKGKGVDVLVMTATPIPRTLVLTAYGDMEVSRLTEKPAGRQPVDTRTLPLERLSEVVGAVGRAIEQGAKVYWVCPLVEESEAVDLADAEARYGALTERFPGRVALVHGRMKGPEKDRAMQAFAEGPADILVATTVIEVGVDVPAATVMVIEQAERFGLAQLHQLRGRIGRGGGRSTCLLLYRPPLGETAHERLKILRESDDGFRIAEEDLRLRGAGDVLGTQQSGLPRFRLADLAEHAELLPMARDHARLILERDPDLQGDRGPALRTLLYLFERDAAVRYLRSG
ncbi:ATP-dependent DNA helicase RecG [Aquibaculum sediminis]|uniref:ATP-dependent DNA helicase RecG n=1 Tax=Aquibaculum sediminis TaxID=3231907 RepID=UPI0034546036